MIRIEPGFADEAATRGHGDETDRIEAVAGGEFLGLVEGFEGDGGDMDLAGLEGPVIGEVFERVGGGAGELIAHRLFKRIAGRAVGVEIEIADLVVGDHQLAGHAGGIERQPPVAQLRQGVGQVGHIERDVAHAVPARIGPVQKGQAFKREGEGA